MGPGTRRSTAVVIPALSECAPVTPTSPRGARLALCTRSVGSGGDGGRRPRRSRPTGRSTPETNGGVTIVVRHPPGGSGHLRRDRP